MSKTTGKLRTDESETNGKINQPKLNGTLKKESEKLEKQLKPNGKEKNSISTPEQTIKEKQCINTKSQNSDSSTPVIKLRRPKKIEMVQLNDDEALSGNVDANAARILQRTMGALYEASPDMEDNNEEIRRLDSQLDHLSEYMDRVEERLKQHNAKLMETLNQQKEEREKRRRSFHERLDANRQEDVDFQRQLSQILNRVDSARKRQSLIEIPFSLTNSLTTQPENSDSNGLVNETAENLEQKMHLNSEN